MNTQNYNKKCDKCNGKYLLYTVKGKSLGWFFKETDTHIVCDNCDFGVVKPKQVIHRIDRFEPEIIY